MLLPKLVQKKKLTLYSNAEINMLLPTIQIRSLVTIVCIQFMFRCT